VSARDRIKLFNNYLTRRKSPSTLRVYNMIAEDFCDYLDTNKIDFNSINLMQCEAFLSGFQVADRSLSLYSYALASFIDFCGKNELSKLIPVTRYTISEPRWLERKDLEIIFKKCTNDVNRIMMKTAFEFAMRVGEVVKVKWDDIDFKNKTISFFREKKRRQERKVKPVPEYLIKELRGLNRVSDFIFSSYGGRSASGWHNMSIHYANEVFRESAEKCGFDGYTFHCLRHSRATEVAILTQGNIVEICKVTDHDEPRNALIYVHIALERMRQLMGK
jgi:integrase